MEIRQRVEAALSLAENIDRPPVTAWGHHFAAEWDAALLAQSTVARAVRFGWDLVKLQPRASCFAEAFGADYRPSGRELEAPRLHATAIRDAGSWTALRPVDISTPPLADQIRALQLVAAEIGEARPVYATVFSPFTVASYLAADARAEAARPRPDLIAKDQTRAVRHLVERPEQVGPALAAIAATLVEFVRRCIDAGADGIFYAIGGSASSVALDTRVYAELLLPHDLEVLAAVPAGVPVILHLCGADLNFELARALPIVAVSWATAAPGNPSLAAGRARSGRAVVGGVAEVADLVEGGPEAVDRAVRAAVAETGGRGLIVAPGCSVPPTADNRSFAALAASATPEPV